MIIEGAQQARRTLDMHVSSLSWTAYANSFEWIWWMTGTEQVLVF